MKTVANSKNIHHNNTHTTKQKVIATKSTTASACSILQPLQWNEVKRKTRQPTQTTMAPKRVTHSNNMYDIFLDDNISPSTTHKSTYLLDTAASGNYGDMQTTVINKQAITPGEGIQVGCANGNVMSQVAKADVPFQKYPQAAKDMQLFIICILHY